MVNLKETWSQISIQERIFHGITIVLSCIVVVLSFIGLSGIIDISITNSIVVPILCFVTLMNGMLTYKKNKALGIIIICCGIITFCFCVAVFYIRFVVG